MEAEMLDRAFEAELESELRMVREAALLVLAGGARRVVVANLRHGRVIAEPARAMACEAGLDLQLIPTADARRVDIAVARVAAGERPTAVEQSGPARRRLGIVRAPG